MADIRWADFAACVRGALEDDALSYSAAVARWPDLNRAMLSRAVAGKRLSAASFVLVCARLDFDPIAFLSAGKHRRTTLTAIAKRHSDQPVTEGVARETSSASRAAPPPAAAGPAAARATWRGVRSDARPAVERSKS